MKILLLIILPLSWCLCWRSLNEQLDKIVDQVDTNKGLAGSSELDDLWIKYKALHGAPLQDEGDCKREFEDNVKYVIGHNRQYKLGVYSYKLGIHNYSHLSHKEFSRRVNGFRRPKAAQAERQNYRDPSNGVRPPQKDSCDPVTLDWRTKGVVTPVQDQGLCGSCYAFSATGALEALHALKKHNLTCLSNQQLVDCSGKWGNYGCNGGFMDYCFDYIREVGGIESDCTYPYTAIDSDCKFLPDLAVATCNFYVNLPADDDDALMKAVSQVGPICVAIDADSQTFFSYREGVYNDTECSPEDVNHAVLLIGYGTEVTNNVSKPYWLVKNSWGATWGEAGYVKMSRLQKNICGISRYASYPI